jgi:hypothetical protein
MKEGIMVQKRFWKMTAKMLARENVHLKLQLLKLKSLEIAAKKVKFQTD